jgi:hypothetical protein
MLAPDEVSAIEVDKHRERLAARHETTNRSTGSRPPVASGGRVESSVVSGKEGGGDCASCAIAAAEQITG